ncbi:pseudoazurin [Kingella kingae]|uniref:pseudoazurin n=1 Tax=Kingella kingae TaxID=504 RepID=UPI0003FB2B67|nr:pseudoazurin [Kingella kingae]
MKKILFCATLLAAMSAHAANYDIKMLNTGKDGSMVFEPAFVKAKVGDTVTFKASTTGHSVKSQAVPKGAESFASGEDEELVVKLTHEGVYVYNCPPHRMMNMSGIIQVGKPTNLSEVKPVVAELENRSMQNKGRLTGYLNQVK